MLLFGVVGHLWRLPHEGSNSGASRATPAAVFSESHEWSTSVRSSSMHNTSMYTLQELHSLSNHHPSSLDECCTPHNPGGCNGERYW